MFENLRLVNTAKASFHTIAGQISVAIGKPERQASRCGSKQRNGDHAPSSLYCCLFAAHRYRRYS